MATFVMASTELRFKVRRAPAVLVAPAAPTPHELKRLSDIDDQEGLRFHAPGLVVYRRNPSCDGLDPVAVIRDAVARALVPYYPLAGRLRELEARKLAVDCTAEGVPFVEADADIRLDDFGDTVQAPLPCLEELLFDVAATPFTVNSALVYVQVTRLACGGFILAVQMCHTVADALGTLQFLEAVGELARGAAAPTVHPVWARHLLLARTPPRPSFAHREYDADVLLHDPVAPPDDPLVQRYFFFGRQDVAAVRALVAPGLIRARSTTFDVLTAFVWKCRTMALHLPDAGEEVRLGFAVSACHVKRGLRVPRGYYGNTIVFPVAVSTAGELCANPLGYAVELVCKAKAEVDAEYIQSVADLMVLRRRPEFRVSFLVTDHTKVGFSGVDFGWGPPVHGEVATMSPSIPRRYSLLIAGKNAKGEAGIFVPIWLPGHAMDRFTEEVGKLMRPPPKMSSL